MSFFSQLTVAVRRQFHRREIEKALTRYRQRTGADADKVERFSDSGTFRNQLDRLFALGNASETEALMRIAESVVGASVTNRYYRPADFLSDLLNDLEHSTFFGFDNEGEAPLGECKTQFERDSKLKFVQKAWLVPLKVAAIETLTEEFARLHARGKPYQTVQRFERSVSRVASYLDQSEIHHVQKTLSHWLESDEQGDPVAMLEEMLVAIEGRAIPPECDALRTRRTDQAFRLSTLVPEDRQYLLRAVLSPWASEHGPV